MKRFTLILTGVLAVQLLLAFVLTFGGANNEAFRAEEPLLAFEKDKVDEIVIGQTGGSSVALHKQNDKWLIPSMAEFPANSKAVGDLVDKLAALKKGWPVATTSDAAERFKVAKDSHERQIELKSGGDTLATLLVGTSSTYRETNVRAADENEIYSGNIGAYEAGVRGEDWMDRDFLKLDRDKIASISIGDITLEQKDGKFTLAGLGPAEKLKEAEIQPIIGAISAPRFDVVQGKGEEALAKLDPADLEITVKRKEGDPVTYKFKKEAEGGAYLFANSAQPYVFRVAEATIKPITEAKREKLIEQPKAEEKPKEEQPEAAETQPGGPGG